MSRTRTLLVAVLAATALVGAGAALGASATQATGPGPGGQPTGTDALDAVDFDAALSALGDDATGGTSDRMGPGHRFRHRGADRMLHGEVVVKGKDDAPVTVAIQRGEVTAVGDNSVTVASEDGYERTWVLDDETRYRSFRAEAGKGSITVGATVRLAGPVTDGSATARIIGIPPADGAGQGTPDSSSPETSSSAETTNAA